MGELATFVSGCIDLLKSEEVRVSAKEFVKYIEENIDSVVNKLERLDKALAGKVSEIICAKEDIKEAVRRAFIFMDTIDNFLYYGQSTDFNNIKEDIRKGNTLELKRFISNMDKWLKNIEEAFKSFIEQCNRTSHSCTQCAISCLSQKAEAKAKKNKAIVVGGIVSAGMLGASFAAGVFTLGTGTFVGLYLTAAATASLGLTASAGAVVAQYVESYISLSAPSYW